MKNYFRFRFWLILLLVLAGLVLSLLTFHPSINTPATAQEKGEYSLRIAVKDNIRPLGFLDDTGTLQGLEIDIAHKLGEQLFANSNAVQLIPVSNQNRLKFILEEKVNLTIARVTATETRGRIVDFSLPYYMDGAAIITNQPAINSFQQLRNQTIAVLNNSDTIANIKYFIPDAKLVGVDSYQAGKTLIEQQKATAFAADASVLTGWIQENAGYHILPVLLTAEPLSIVMPKGLQYANLRLEVNNAIETWQADGWLASRIQYWGLPQTER